MHLFPFSIEELLTKCLERLETEYNPKSSGQNVVGDVSKWGELSDITLMMTFNSESVWGHIDLIFIWLFFQVMRSLVLSREGLSENEITEMLELSDQEWSPIYFALDKYLVKRQGLLG